MQSLAPTEVAVCITRIKVREFNRLGGSRRDASRWEDIERTDTMTFGFIGMVVARGKDTRTVEVSHIVEDKDKGGGPEEPEGGLERELAEERQEDGILVAHGMTS